MSRRRMERAQGELVSRENSSRRIAVTEGCADRRLAVRRSSRATAGRSDLETGTNGELQRAPTGGSAAHESSARNAPGFFGGTDPRDTTTGQPERRTKEGSSGLVERGGLAAQFGFCFFLPFSCPTCWG